MIRGDVEHGLTYTVRRGDGVTLGEDEVVDLTAEDAGFTRTCARSPRRPTPAVVDALAERGIEYVVLPAPADGDVAAALDATGGLVQASAEDRSTRAWQVGRPLDPTPSTGRARGCGSRCWCCRALAILVVAVLCAPTEREEAPAMSQHRRPGARSARAAASRLDATTVLAVVLPLLTVGALLLVRPDDARGRRRAAHPDRADQRVGRLPVRAARRAGGATSPPPSRGVHGDGRRPARRADDVAGRAVAGAGHHRAAGARARSWSPARATSPPAWSAAASAARPLAAVRLPAARARPVVHRASAPERDHDSVLELVNPDAGPGRRRRHRARPAPAPSTCPRLRGVSVPGRSSVRLDLGAGRAAPRRARAARGHLARPARRLGARQLRRARRRRASQDWLPAQAGPSTDNVLLGLAAGAGDRTLALANPGDDEVRATVQVRQRGLGLRPRGRRARSGCRPRRRPGVSPGRARPPAIADGRRSASRSPPSGPVTATLRTFADGDLRTPWPVRHPQRDAR